ncbi:MAG: sugar ABC transporter substrate-binding protein [Silicimonas sp.]|uniref:ABC transporter substrate-binding protein n=1 Tax=Alphaproteobacteria TaxID=28211 RepID=UPI0032ECDA37
MWRSIVTGTAATALAAIVLPAAVQASEISGDITIWSWDIGAAALQDNVASFEAANPGVSVTVDDLGNAQVHDRLLAACAAGGVGLPDIVSVQNRRAEVFWLQFPSCFTDLTELGYDDEVAALFPDYKRTELEVGDARYAMPWDTGPVVMFYRRDYYEAAGISPDDIETWDDFIEAGKAVMEANDGVVMTQATLNSDAEFFEMIGNENGCTYFSEDGETVTLNSPACAEALDVVKRMYDEGIMTAADWSGKLQSAAAGIVATHMFGGWYEGSIRPNVPEDQAGSWGVYRMPSVKEGGPRAANFGGSALLIPATSENPEAAFAYLLHAVGTPEGQVTMLREQGLVPSLLTALEHPYVQEPLEFWGGQAIWTDVLETLPDIMQVRGTPHYGEANTIMARVQLAYLNGEYASAEEALADAAQQISFASGLPLQ